LALYQWIRIAKEKGVHYVDMWRLGNNDPFKRDPKKYYSADGFHPSEDGYGDWYDHIDVVIKATTFGQKQTS
jgi:lysophospholipase L1-like esterase